MSSAVPIFEAVTHFSKDLETNMFEELGSECRKGQFDRPSWTGDLILWQPGNLCGGLDKRNFAKKIKLLTLHRYHCNTTSCVIGFRASPDP
jgi:hypothetical protein